MLFDPDIIRLRSATTAMQDAYNKLVGLSYGVRRTKNPMLLADIKNVEAQFELFLDYVERKLGPYLSG